MHPPGYFSRIQTRASQRWGQLESDPELAAPWHQLFRQVQSPRHVLSELLQNADDAEASTAAVRIEGNHFIFEHDGSDFDENQFESLCRFGFSNKRNLHTIGFRGVGFKSTFSLGDIVEVYTPTLNICFNKKRFTQPNWLENSIQSERTIVRVRVRDENCLLQLRKNFEEWAQSPVSLLFFKNLKALNIGGKVIRRQRLANGPVADSSWMELVGISNAEKLLVIQSEAIPFTNEASEEVLSERGVGADEFQLPPCRVEVVFGMSSENRIYVVLPTGATLELPFSCNAPFIQDPARFSIKDPAASPTNRWLLQRIGGLVGKTIRQWLANVDLSPKERAAAYGLLKNGVRFSSGQGGACSQIIVESMLAELKAEKVVLTIEGTLAKVGEVVAVPEELFSVWDSGQLLEFFAHLGKRIFASEASEYADKLREYGWVIGLDSSYVLERLMQNHILVPCPNSWPRLNALWSFVENRLRHNDWDGERRKRIKMVPVDGNKLLHPANEVVRLSSRSELLSQEDWKFVMSQTATLNGKWLDWLSKESGEYNPARVLLQVLGLNEPSSVNRIAVQASLRIFSEKSVSLYDCVRAAHIMAALGAAVPDGFLFVTKDGSPKTVGAGIVTDETGVVEDITPEEWAKKHILHDEYTNSFRSCKAETWRQWIRSPGSKLLSFPRIWKKDMTLIGRSNLKKFSKLRGGTEPSEFHYRREMFAVKDFMFDKSLVSHWENIGKSDAAVWPSIAKGVLTAPEHFWIDKVEVEIRDTSINNSKPLDCGTISAEWIQYLRQKPCLPDGNGSLRVPSELLMLTPETEPLRGVEPFVKLDLDTESTKPLLKLLGVRDTPANADALITRLSAFSSDRQPLMHLSAIARFYEAIDRIVVRCEPEKLIPIKEAFSRKPLVFTEAGDWLTSSEVSIFPDDDNLFPIIHSSLRNLALWPRIGVSERPEFEHTMEWLGSLQSRAKLEPAVAKRVRAILQRDPVRVWNECLHWLTLESTWVPVGELRHRITMQSLMKWGELFPTVKHATANLQMVSTDIASQLPFRALPNLGDVVQFHVTDVIEMVSRKNGHGTWLFTLANALGRVKLFNDEEKTRIGSIAKRLHKTEYKFFKRLHVTPYIGGEPAGEPFTPDVLWQDTVLYVANKPVVQVYRGLVEELSRPFDSEKITDAIVACIDRTSDFINEYFDAHFEMTKQLDQSAPDSPELPPAPVGLIEAESTRAEEEKKKKIAVIDDEPIGQNSAEALPNGDRLEPISNQDTSSTTIKKDVAIAKSQAPPLIETYAWNCGFRGNASDRVFVHSDGRKIVKSESPFNWEERNAAGKVIAYMWVTEQSLAKGVEVAYELWMSLGKSPESTVLIVIDENDAPQAIAGKSLLKLKDSGQIKLFPSRYRIVESVHL